MAQRKTEVLLDGLNFPESPRWRNGKLWFSDLFAQRVATLDANGKYELIAEFNESPSGIGFLPDGSPIVALMSSQHLVRLDKPGNPIYADISVLGGRSLNDMIIDSTGRAYLDLMFSKPSVGRPDKAIDCLATVDIHGKVSIAARGLFTPNGLALTGDGKTLIVDETSAHQMTSFSVAPDGSLSNQKIFASFESGHPDGMCVDEEGCAWVGAAMAHKYIRVAPGGKILETIKIADDRLALACTLGGPDRRTLYMVSSQTGPDIEKLLVERKSKNGFIECCRVDVPGAGYP